MSVAWSFAALVAWIVLPGVALASMIGRDSPRPSPVRVLTVAMAGGFSTWFLGTELLARFDLMSSAGAVISTVLVAAVSLGVILGPGRAGVVALWNRPLLIEVGVLLGAAVVASVPLIILVLGRRDSISGTTPWYYLELARAVATTHGVPSHAAEWATRLPFLDDYPGFTSGTALLLAIGGAKSMAAVQAVRLLTLLAVGGSAYLFARAVGAARSAAAVSVVVLFVGATFVGKLASYRPESTAYALVFLVAALAKLWMDERRNVDLVLATITLLALSEVHGIGWLFCALIVAGIGAAALLFAPERRSALRAAALLGVATIGGWLLGNLALGGGLSGAGKLGGLPGDGDTDPTWRFVNRVAGRLVDRPRPAVSEVAERSISRGFIALGGWWLLVTVVVVVALLLVVAWRGRARIRNSARQFTVMAVLVLAAAVAISVWFAVRWSTYVPLRTGWGRLFPLTYMLLPAAVAIVITAVPNRRARLIAGVVVLALSVGVMVHGRDVFDGLDREQPSRIALADLRSLGLSRDDLVLTNTYSEGFVGAVLGARGVLDGRAPYSEPKTLDRANRLLGESITFFANPLTTPLPVDAHGVKYLLVATDPSALGTPLVFFTNYDTLDQRPDLERVHDGPGYRLYRVTPPTP